MDTSKAHCLVNYQFWNVRRIRIPRICLGWRRRWWWWWQWNSTSLLHNPIIALKFLESLKTSCRCSSMQSDSTFFFLLFFQISSVTSMSFLTDPNLTFHRFSDGTISCDGRKAMPNGAVDAPVWTTGLDYSTTNPTLLVNESATSTTKILSPADDSGEVDSVSKRFSTYSSTFNNSTPSTPHPTYTGSTMKLIQVKKEDSVDSSNKQVSKTPRNIYGNSHESRRGKFPVAAPNWFVTFKLSTDNHVSIAVGRKLKFSWCWCWNQPWNKNSLLSDATWLGCGNLSTARMAIIAHEML